jgi:hypothetical protein
MATENLEINIGANTQDLQNGLNQASQSVTNFGTQIAKAAKPTGDATNALTNLSRVAQDAPYGFMGIANNLNPLLESFQRLSKETGSAGGALKSMVGGLMGPAGIGVALGVVSSLIVAFGDDINNFFIKLAEGSIDSVRFRDAFKGIGDEFTTSVKKVNDVEIAFAEYHKGILTGEQALKIYNTQLSGNLGIKKNINEAEAVFKAKTADYIEAQLQRALADSASKKAAEELLKIKQIEATGGEKTSPVVKFFATLPTLGIGADKTYELIDKAKAGKAIATSEEIIRVYKEIAEKAKSASDLIAKNAEIKLDPEKTKITKQRDYGLQDSIAALEFDTKATEKWANEQMKIHDKMYDFYKKYGDAVKAVTNVSSTREMIADQDKRREKEEKIPISERKIEIPPNIKMMEASIKKFDKELKDSQETMQKYASFMASTLTDGIMAMFDAFASGENPLQALGDFVGDLIRKLAEAAIQAAILQGIMMAFGLGGGGGFAGGFIGGFKKILGFAEGGIVSQPTIAMVGEGGQSEAIMPLNKLGNMMNSTFNAGAMSGTGGGNGQFVLKGNDLVLALQRSNYSLNLRRGNGI